MMSSKKSRNLGYNFDFFLKDLMQYPIYAKFHRQDLTGSGFMTRSPFAQLTPPPDYST